jgi:hypothetical protein
MAGRFVVEARGKRRGGDQRREFKAEPSSLAVISTIGMIRS